MIKKVWHENEIHKLMSKHLVGYKSLVMVSGYFAVLPHEGHIRLINEAKEFGYRLIVLVNGPEATRKKYSFEPIPAEDRANNLAQYAIIDYVLIWDHDNVADAIRTLKPSVFCNGGDITIDTINPDELKAANEIECRIMFGVGGYDKKDNTSELIKSIYYGYVEK